MRYYLVSPLSTQNAHNRTFLFLRADEAVQAAGALERKWCYGPGPHEFITRSVESLTDEQFVSIARNTDWYEQHGSRDGDAYYHRCTKAALRQMARLAPRYAALLATVPTASMEDVG